MPKVDLKRRWNLQKKQNQNNRQFINIEPNRELRCTLEKKNGELCNKLLAKGTASAPIEMKCPRCKGMNRFEGIG